MTSDRRKKGGVTSELGDVLLALTARVREDRARDLNASIVLSVGDEAWTLRFCGGRLAVAYGAVRRPDTLVRADALTLIEINSGRLSGARAFLDGRIAIRGDMGLALRMESLFDHFGGGPDGAIDVTTVRAGRNDLSVMTAGAGEAVVLLHGLGATKASLLPTALALSAEYRVVAPDLLGHGDSDKPLARYDAATFARSIAAMMDAMGIDSAHLVGNSLGGRASLELALRYRDRVRSLGLLCPAMAMLTGRQAVPVVRALRPEIAALQARIPQAVVVQGIRRLFSDPSRLPRSWYLAGADEFARCWRSPRNRVAVASALRSLYVDEPRGPRGFWARLGRLDAPALFVWGDRDRLVPAGFHRHVVRTLPRAESVVLEDCGHVPQFEQPERTHALLRDFLARSGVTARRRTDRPA